MFCIEKISDSYYPFGMKQSAMSYLSGSSEQRNFFLYNGKELQTDFDIDWYDYGARFYDPQLGRFHTADALTDAAPNRSPYRYAFNNPINIIDPDGNFEDWYVDQFNNLVHIPDATGDIPGSTLTWIGAENGTVPVTVSARNPGSDIGSFTVEMSMKQVAGSRLYNTIIQGVYEGQKAFAEHPVGALFIGLIFGVAEAGIMESVVLSGTRLGTGFSPKIKTSATKGSTLAKYSGILLDAAKFKGNFGLGKGTTSETLELGKAWVGKGYTIASDGKTLVSSNGLRQFRPPSFKPKLGIQQANFQWRNVNRGGWQGNGHLDIIK